MAEVLVTLMLALAAIPAIGAASYLAALTLLSAPRRAPARSSRKLRFDIVVPAHDEAEVIGACLKSLERLDWPREGYRVIVVADNCTDATAPLARVAGAFVLERRDPLKRGKGYALAHAFDYSRDSRCADAVVVVDADTEVSPNLLEEFAARIERGAQAIQADYGVLNPSATWRTRLMAIAHGAFHTLRSNARERLALSCGVRGNGWCVTHALLERMPYRCFTLVEDLEYGIALGLDGVRVEWAGEAHALGEMAVRASVAERQRQRWEGGRFALIRARTGPLLRAAWRTRSRVCLDLALDLIVLPLSYVALWDAAFLAGSVSATLWRPSFGAFVPVALACVAALVVYVLRGVALSGRGLAGVADLVGAPFYLAWKLAAMAKRHDRTEWAPSRRRGP